MSIERSRHTGLKIVRKASPLLDDDEATDPIGTNLASDGEFVAFVDVKLGARQAVVLTPQLFVKGDRAKDSDWFSSLSPITIKKDGRYFVPFQANGSKNLRIAVRGQGGKADGSECAIDIRWRE